MSVKVFPVYAMSMPSVQMNLDHINASVRMAFLVMERTALVRFYINFNPMVIDVLIDIFSVFV